MKRRLVLKLSGELLERPEDLQRIAAGIASLAGRASLVVVHGGGREIDAALATAGIPKRPWNGYHRTGHRKAQSITAAFFSMAPRACAAYRVADLRSSQTSRYTRLPDNS